MEMTRPIIYINGWPGAGKETISMALVTLLGGDDEARLVRRLFLPSVKDCVN
jgi:adenylylsulfate kinase-like enzyme